MIKKIFLNIALILTSLLGVAQSYEYVYRNSEDSSINCYLKVLPKTDSIQGLIVRDFSNLPDTSKANPYKFQGLTTNIGFITIYTVTSKRFPELYYFDNEAKMLDEIINEVVIEHKIPKQNIFIGGISASGTRALRFAIFCEQGKSKYSTKINSVFAVDSPLDLERFYYSAKNNINNFKDGMLWEAELILKKFPEYIGTPIDDIEKYQTSSVHSYRTPAASNLKYLQKTPILFFHEPDINWWLENRGASYYDINSFDIANAAAYFKHIGNNDVKVITTSNKGYDRNGNRKCHSWTIVDEEALVKWIQDHTK